MAAGLFTPEKEMKKTIALLALLAIAGCGSSQDQSPHTGKDPKIPIPQWKQPLPTVPPVETSTPDPDPTPTPDVTPTFTPLTHATPAPPCPNQKEWLCHHPQGDRNEPFSCIWMCQSAPAIEAHLKNHYRDMQVDEPTACMQCHN